MKQVGHKVLRSLCMDSKQILNFSAIAGVDYQSLRRNVTLSQAKTSEDLVVTILQDKITERTETFGARIIIPVETQQLGVQLGPLSSLIIKILDDDRKLAY